VAIWSIGYACLKSTVTGKCAKIVYFYMPNEIISRVMPAAWKVAFV
jgi:hypothetical protein